MTRGKESGFTTLQIILIVAGMLVLVVVGLAAIAMPRLMKSQQAARETAAYGEVRFLATAQLTYKVTKGRGQYTDLQTLAKEGLVSSSLTSGARNGYIYTCVPVTVQGMPPMFDITAKPASTGKFGTGNVSYYINENQIVYEAEGGEPPTATPQDRVPKDGKPADY